MKNTVVLKVQCFLFGISQIMYNGQYTHFNFTPKMGAFVGHTNHLNKIIMESIKPFTSQKNPSHMLICLDHKTTLCVK